MAVQNISRRSSSFLELCVWVSWCGRRNLNPHGKRDLCVCTSLPTYTNHLNHGYPDPNSG